MHMGMRQRLSTSFHPQTDGQMEQMNQTIEQYIRLYCNYQPDNWTELLSLAEFAYNNAFQTTIKCSPFYANYGYHPRFSMTPQNQKITMSAPAAATLANQLRTLHEKLIENIKLAQNHQAKFYDARHKPIEFQRGDRVWLLSRNIRTECPNKKLDWKRLGPYTVIERIGTQAYRLDLPRTMKIHPVFHISLLEQYKPSIIPGRIQEPPPSIIINGEFECEVEDILDSKYLRRRLFYFVKWKGHPESENSWEPATEVENAPRLTNQFHARYPKKPGPSPVHNLHVTCLALEGGGIVRNKRLFNDCSGCQSNHHIVARATLFLFFMFHIIVHSLEPKSCTNLWDPLNHP